MKCCTKCLETKPLDCFSWKIKSKGRKSPVCKECHKKIRNKHYRDNKAHDVSTITLRREELKNWYRDFKATLKCERCGQDHPATIQFHHPDPSIKEFEISRAVHNGFSIETIMKEVEKCEILCSNCHLIEHWGDKYMAG